MSNSHAWKQARMPAHNLAQDPACPRALRRAAARRARTRAPIPAAPTNIRRARISDAAELSDYLDSAIDRLIDLRTQAG